MYLINLASHPETLSCALKDLVSIYGWTKYIVLYENDDGLFRLQGVLQLSEVGGKAGYFMKIPSGDDYRPFLYEVLDEEIYAHFVIDCAPAIAYQILKQAQQIGLLNSRIHIIFTTLDLATLDLDDFKYSRAMIVAPRVVDPDREEVKEVIRHWHEYASSVDTDGEDSENQSDNSKSGSSNYDSNSPNFYERFDIEHLGRTRSRQSRRAKRSEEEIEGSVDEPAILEQR
ncbi:unnamed protein product, partial [Allacma fusca]